MIEVILLLGLTAGLATWFLDDLLALRDRAELAFETWFNSLKPVESLPGKSSKKGDAVEDHLRMLLQITLGLGTDKGVKVFAAVSGLLGGITFLVLSHRVSAELVLAAMAGSMMVPYGLLRLRLQQLRVQSSREGEILITELLENYKIQYFNMEQAIQVTAMTIEEAPNSKRLLFYLSKGLNRVGTPEEIRRLLEEFRLSINTSWAGILSANLFFALSWGIQVTEALEDLSLAIADARKIDELSRQEHQEAGIMLRYLAPICYGLTVAGGLWMFGLTPGEFVQYQFRSQLGLTWLVISLLLYGSGVFLHSFISRSKLDF